MKLLVYPRANKNPYQKLLYTAMQANHDVQLAYIETKRSIFILFPFYLLLKRLQGYAIFHLHWPSFYVQKSYPMAPRLSYLLSVYCIMALRFCGMKIVWTVHNVVPHENETTDDKKIARMLASTADVAIIHSKYTLDEMKMIAMHTDHAYVVPHGNYHGVYKDDVTASEARAALNIAPNETVFLFFGMIRGYKGVDELIDAYKSVRTNASRLLIIGRCEEPALKERIETAALQPDIDCFLDFVADDDVATYFKASDLVALPFRTVTTSGSALLALTFCKPIIAPRSGSLVDIPAEAGYFYDPTDQQGLATTLRAALTDTEQRTSKVQAASEYGKQLEWSSIADTTYDLYTRKGTLTS